MRTHVLSMHSALLLLHCLRAVWLAPVSRPRQCLTSPAFCSSTRLAIILGGVRHPALKQASYTLPRYSSSVDDASIGSTRHAM
ncbi:hypothetical protein BD626DRAFT_198634 [Schizophyllum amplum]|uniref:Secreted protein n=1 Tax=Schizophyllum amplum TaxID=97359 RepID=A0A550CN83_9AGAR|nr:hypothetical protein BD626DRAFT_198634 [Auriculariopsis ampla]